MRSKLSWKLNDYKKYDIEPPDELFSNPDKSEGEIMEDEDVEDWAVEIIKTFRVLKDGDKELFDELYENFTEDVKYLVNIKKLNDEAAEEILNKDNFDLP